MTVVAAPLKILLRRRLQYGLRPRVVWTGTRSHPHPASRSRWTSASRYPNYLYLIWSDAGSNEIYTSVLQSAESLNQRFTRSQPAFYRTTFNDFGSVSWTRGLEPGDNIQGLFTNVANMVPYQLEGNGPY